ncbi:MAG TPA: FAD-binding oxidoreductase [Candidatus Marinimicrobia bacterium]|nr:FAD-binding oxidoreductase [Candidatus Neomarinimicrobiota bacterium]
MIKNTVFFHKLKRKGFWNNKIGYISSLPSKKSSKLWHSQFLGFNLCRWNRQKGYLRVTNKKKIEPPYENVFWLKDEILRFDPLRQNLTADLAIIGGGITGITAAKRLAELGASVILLENRCIGTGASGRNAGFVISGPVEHYSRAVNIIGRDKAKRLWSDSEKGISHLIENIENCAIRANAEREGSYLLADSEQEDAEVRETAKAMHSDHFDCDYLPAEAVRDILKTDAFFGGLFLNSNFAFHPYRYVTGLAKFIHQEQKNVQLFDESPVSKISSDGENRPVIHTAKGKVTAQMLLLATNAWTQQLDSRYEGLIIPVRGQVIATAPLDKRYLTGAMYANFGFEYFRQLQSGELIIGGWRENMPGGDAFHYNENIEDKAVQGLLDYIRGKFPQLPKLTVSHQWAGTMGFSRDGLPLLGPLPGKNSIFIAAGFTGHGMAFGTIIGKYAAEAIAGELSEDISIYSPTRFVK